MGDETTQPEAPAETQPVPEPEAPAADAHADLRAALADATARAEAAEARAIAAESAHATALTALALVPPDLTDAEKLARRQATDLERKSVLERIAAGRGSPEDLVLCGIPPADPTDPDGPLRRSAEALARMGNR